MIKGFLGGGGLSPQAPPLPLANFAYADRPSEPVIERVV